MSHGTVTWLAQFMSHGIVTSLGWLMSLTSKGGKKTEVFLLLLSHHIELPTFFFFFSSGTTPGGRRVCPPVARESRRATGGRPCGPARPPARPPRRQAGSRASFLRLLSLSISPLPLSSSPVLVFFCPGVWVFLDSGGFVSAEIQFLSIGSAAIDQSFPHLRIFFGFRILLLLLLFWLAGGWLAVFGLLLELQFFPFGFCFFLFFFFLVFGFGFWGVFFLLVQSFLW